MLNLLSRKLAGGQEIVQIIYEFKEEGDAPPEYNENEVAEFVDLILHEEDLSQDGFIDYGEFIYAQQRQAAAAMEQQQMQQQQQQMQQQQQYQQQQQQQYQQQPQQVKPVQPLT